MNKIFWMKMLIFDIFWKFYWKSVKLDDAIVIVELETARNPASEKTFSENTEFLMLIVLFIADKNTTPFLSDYVFFATPWFEIPSDSILRMLDVTKTYILIVCSYVRNVFNFVFVLSKLKISGVFWFDSMFKKPPW